MATDPQVKHYLDESGEPIVPSIGMKIPDGYSLLSSKKEDSPKKAKTLKEVKAQAEKIKPVVPPTGYVLSAYSPTVLEQMRNAVANSAIGHSLESTLPGIADALNLHPSESSNSPTYEQHKEQILAPEYLTPTAMKVAGSVLPEAERKEFDTKANKERVEGGLTAAGQLTSGKNLALAAGTAVAAGATAGLLNPATAGILGRLVSGGFTLDMLHGLYQQNREYHKAVDAGDLDTARKIQGEMGVTGVMALLTGKHALTKHPFTPVTEAPPRERTNVLHRNEAGEVRQGNGQAPTVWLSPDAWKSFMGELYPGENPAETNGINLPANDAMKHFATEHKPETPNPAFGQVQELLNKAHEGAGQGGVAIAKNRPSIASNVNVMREELNHTWQRSLTGKMSDHLDEPAQEALYQKIPQPMFEHLEENGYDSYNSPVMVVETAAKLMDGRPERFGVKEDDAIDFLDNYFKEVAAKHGSKALEELKHVRGIAADAKARAIEEHGRAGQDNNAVPSVAEGGQGGAPEGVPAEREVVSPTDPLFNRDKEKPTWYLKSEKLIGEKMKGPQAGDDVHKMLVAGGIKPEEMQWTGLDDFLKAKGKTKVTPDEIREHLSNNNIQIKEVTKGSNEPKGKYLLFDEAGDFAGDTDDMQEAIRHGLSTRGSWADRNDNAGRYYLDNAGTDAKYGSYTLPGGQNYREMLLTMPPRMEDNPNARSITWAIEGKEPQGAGAIPQPASHEQIQKMRDRGFTVNDLGPAKQESVKDNFRSNHWDEPNILAHVRFNDRTGPNGEKLLHVEEVQSDWHQKGRDKGYTNKDARDESFKKTANLYAKARDIINNKVERLGYESIVQAMRAVEQHPDWADRWDARSSLTPEEISEVEAWREAKAERDRLHSGSSVPDAPFKKTWHEMALRRILKMAADKGYDGVSWTPGADQNERYSLSHQVEKIAVPMVNENGSRSVRIDPIGGGHNSFKLMVDADGTVDGSHNASQFSGKKLDEVVGKDMAEKIMSAEEPTEFEGKGLDVGGSGMRGFYDKIVPDYLNKFGKKFGAKVSDTQVPDVGGADKNGYFDYSREGDKYEVYQHGMDSVGSFDTPEEAAAEVDRRNALLDRGAMKTVQYLPITPEMRQSVSGEGVPLFNREQVKTPEFKTWFGDSKAVDEDGKPKVMYHGTTSNFTAFAPGRGAQLGSHFGTPEQANAIVKGFEEYGYKPQVMPVYLSIKNPLRLTDYGDFSPSEVAPQLKDMGIINDELFDDAVNGVGKEQDLDRKIKNAIKKKGYDGVVYLNRREGSEADDSDNDLSDEDFKAKYPDAQESWIAFSPTQVKSATGNSGAFDPKDPNILRNRYKSAGNDPKDESEQPETKYKFGSTQINLPADSAAHGAITAMQASIPAADLAGKGKDVDDPHVTVRYGLKTNLTPELRKFIESQAPFEASLGPTTAFPPSEHSDGAAPIVAAVESPELHRLNKEIEEQGDFAPSSFDEYKPHVTVAYVKPEAAEKYTGMKDAAGKTFPITSISVSDKNGDKIDIPLKGKSPSATEESKNTEPNTEEKGSAEKTPEPAGGGSNAPTSESSIVPVQGGTHLASAPVMIPVVPVPMKNVLPLHKVKEMAAKLNPVQPQVRSVRELMEMAKKMVP